MTDDISRQTIFVLVVLTLLVSILGTWTVLSHVDAGQAAPTGSPKVDSGKVVLGIEGVPQGGSPDLASGHVIFAIEQPEEE